MGKCGAGTALLAFEPGWTPTRPSDRGSGRDSPASRPPSRPAPGSNLVAAAHVSF